MIINNFSENVLDSGGKKVSAEIHWEDCDRPVKEIYFEVSKEHRDKIALNAAPFLLASFIPAIKTMEKRVKVDEYVCPETILGIQRTGAFISHWHYPDRESQIVIETKRKNKNPIDRVPKRKSAFFFSGGIDSLATLLRNREIYPKDNENSISYGITAYGLEIEKKEQLSPVETKLDTIADQAGIERITLKTNVRSLDENWQFWEYQWQGSVLASLAHVFAPSIHLVYIASTIDYRNLKPYGSHPLIDPVLGSSYMRIVHDGLSMTRLEKVKLVSKYEYALNNLRCCNQVHKYDDEYINCGECEKCMRTMLALHVIGKLNETKSFRDSRITAEKINTLARLSKTSIIWWREFAPFIKESFDPDLYTAVNTKVFGARIGSASNQRLKALKEKFGKVDKKIFGGKIRSLKRQIDRT